MKLETDQLSSEVAKTKSADDKRTSSTTIGYSGLVFIGVVFLFVIINDVIYVYSHCFP